MSDGIALYREFIGGNERALRRLIDLYGRGLLRFIYGYVRDEGLAEDILSETFIQIYQKRSFRDTGEASFKTYLYTVARNKSLNALKKRKRKKEVSLENISRETQAFFVGEDVDETTERKARALVLHQALSALKREYREVLLLRYFDGLSPERIAVITRRGKKQVYNLLTRGKAALKTQLTQMGYTYENF
jgi:RNA polymerase sigma-70 factor (ECF subfamily)